MEFEKKEVKEQSFLSRIKTKDNWPKIEINFPGTEHPITLKLLSDQDDFEAGMAVDKLFEESKRSIGAHNIDDYEKEKQRQRLYRICLDNATSNPIAKSIDSFRLQITPYEHEALIRQYNKFASSYLPKEIVDEEKIESLRVLLKPEQDNEKVLAYITNIAEAKALILSMVSNMQMNQKD